MAYNRETGMHEGYIYIIKNYKNDYVYIGQTSTDIPSRFNQHISAAKWDKNRNCVLYKAMRKHGIDSFYVEELEQIFKESKKELKMILNEKEIYYIAKYNSYKKGYNSTEGGNLVGNNFSKPVDVYTSDGVYIQSFPSGYDSDRFYNMPLGTTGAACKGKFKRAGGLVFRFSGEPFDKYENTYNNWKTVYKFSEDGEYLDSFENANIAAKDIGITYGSSGLIQAIEKKQLFHGFYYSYDKCFDYVPYVPGAYKIDKYDFDGCFLGTFLSARRAANGDDTLSWKIVKCCRGEIPYASGYVWRFKGDPFDKYPLDLTKSYYVPVDKYTPVGVFLGTYDCASDAGRELGKINGSHILQCCKGERNKAYGFVWRFRGEPFSKYSIKKKTKQNRKMINMYTVDDEFVSQFFNVDMAREFVNAANNSNIYTACRNSGGKAHGYKWYYADDPNQPDKSKIISLN